MWIDIDDLPRKSEILTNKENNNGSKRQRWEKAEKKGAYQKRKAFQEESEKGSKARGNLD